jgi:hypothetical protein
MNTKNFHRKITRVWLTVAFLACFVGMTLAADTVPDPANSTVPQNPFGPKSNDSASTTPAGSSSAATGDNFVPTLRAMLLRRFDKNGDGKLDAAELAEARKVLSGGQDTRVPTPAEAAYVSNGPLFGLRALILKRFDHQNTGQLDAAELAEVNTLLFGPSGPSTNSAEDLSDLQKDILRHFDTKGDGQLDATERAAAKAWLEQIIASLDQPAPDKPAPK